MWMVSIGALLFLFILPALRRALWRSRLMVLFRLTPIATLTRWCLLARLI